MAAAVTKLRQEHAQALKVMHHKRAELESQLAGAATELAEVCCLWQSLLRDLHRCSQLMQPCGKKPSEAEPTCMKFSSRCAATALHNLHLSISMRICKALALSQRWTVGISFRVNPKYHFACTSELTFPFTFTMSLAATGFKSEDFFTLSGA